MPFNAPRAVAFVEDMIGRVTTLLLYSNLYEGDVVMKRQVTSYETLIFSSVGEPPFPTRNEYPYPRQKADNINHIDITKYTMFRLNKICMSVFLHPKTA